MKFQLFLLLTSSLLAFSLTSKGQEEDVSALLVVQQQLDAYNQRDLKAFVQLFSDDVVFVEHATGKISINGKEELKARFKDFFDASPNLRSNLAGRIVMANKVIDHEKITGARNQEGIYELIVIYEVSNNLISKVSTIRKD